MSKRITSFANGDIVAALRRTREAYGLSQRALAERTGLPQSHISKIESGNADIRLSSLIQLARALGLDLRLVPRKALPAVDGVIRSATPRTRANPRALRLARDLDRSIAAVGRLRDAYPDVEALNVLRDDLRAIGELRDTAELDAMRDLVRPLRDLRKIAQGQQPLGAAGPLPEKARRPLARAAEMSRLIRNLLVHGRTERAGLPRPAYRLDDDDTDDLRQHREIGDG